MRGMIVHDQHEAARLKGATMQDDDVAEPELEDLIAPQTSRCDVLRLPATRRRIVVPRGPKS